MKLKVLFLVNIPAPYRIDFFNELGKYCDLTVLIESKSAEHRNDKWLQKEAVHFKSVYLTPTKVLNKTICFDVSDYIESDYDIYVIGVYNTLTSILAMHKLKKYHKKFIISVDGGYIKEDNQIKKWFKTKLLSGASYWLSPSAESDRYLTHYGADVSRIRRYSFTSVLEQDLVEESDITPDKKLALRDKLGMSERKVLLSIGRFSYNKGYGKGYDILMKLAERMPSDVGIYMVGDDPTEEFLEWKKKKGLNQVHFIGFKSKEEIADYYKAADLFILLTRGDVWGLVVNEAMCYGLPVITSDKCIAGIELIHDGDNGYVVSLNDLDDICQKTLTIVNNQKCQGSMSLSSCSIIRDYTIEVMALQHINIFKAVKVEQDEKK